jgi:hypothetical protein
MRPVWGVGLESILLMIKEMIKMKVQVSNYGETKRGKFL